MIQAKGAETIGPDFFELAHFRWRKLPTCIIREHVGEIGLSERVFNCHLKALSET